MSAPGTPRIVGQSRGKKRRWFSFLGGNTLLISILLHVFLGVGATYLVVEHFSKKHVNFVAAAPPAPPEQVEHKVELAQKNTVESAPPDLKRIVTKDVSAITLPEVPDVPTPDDVTPSLMSGVDGVIGTGMSSGAGSGTGGAADGIPPFGASEGEGLQGTFYDLKQTPDRQPTDIAATGAELTTTEAVPNFINLPATKAELELLRTYTQDWNQDILDRYYRAPVKLVADQIFIPLLSAAEAPAAFHVADTVQARRWVIHYQAKVVPPESGEFRFIGFGDDYLLVRVDSRNVLDACEPDQKIDPEVNSDDDVGLAPTYTGHQLYAGRWIPMTQGTPFEMDILIGEGPGGGSSFCLFIEKKGVDYPKGDYLVFQVKDVPVPASNNPASIPPAFSGKKMVFSIAPSDQ